MSRRIDKRSSASEIPSSLLSLTIKDDTDLDLSGSGNGVAADDLSPPNRIDDRLVRRKIDSDNCAVIYEICSKHNISSTMADYLLKLRKFEIVIVCDDSGSMATRVKNTGRTRWDELRSIVKIILEISVKFDSNGVDIYFLNRENFLKVKDPHIVDEAFTEEPDGYTPLVPVLETIFTSRLARCGKDKKLLVFVATDGEPTDMDGEPEVPQLKRLMQETRLKDTTYVSLLLCTDDPVSVGYLDDWDQTMHNVDVTDDFETEREKIRECQEDANYPFSRGDYIVKALVGAIIPSIDRLNQPKKEIEHMHANT